MKLLYSEEVDPATILNLDPAVSFLPYTPNLDIRKSINYKELMKSHGLGPNGAITTSLNIYASSFDETLN